MVRAGGVPEVRTIFLDTDVVSLCLTLPLVLNKHSSCEVKGNHWYPLSVQQYQQMTPLVAIECKQM